MLRASGLEGRASYGFGDAEVFSCDGAVFALDFEMHNVGRWIGDNWCVYEMSEYGARNMDGLGVICLLLLCVLDVFLARREMLRLMCFFYELIGLILSIDVV